jgi:hypothetical protein
MSAHRQDHALRYLVDSHTTQGIQYVVELDTWQGDQDCNGSCTCPHFGFRLEPHLRDGATPQENLRCQHIKEARRKFLGEMILAILEAEQKARPPRRLRQKA